MYLLLSLFPKLKDATTVSLVVVVQFIHKLLKPTGFSIVRSFIDIKEVLQLLLSQHPFI